MNETKKGPLTRDDLADLYQSRTGNKARIRPMDEVADWATRQHDIKVGKDDCFYQVVETKQ